MLSFCKKSVQSLINYFFTSTALTQQNTDHHPTPRPLGLSILTSHDEAPKPSNVLELYWLLTRGWPKFEKKVAPETNNCSCKEDEDDVDIKGRVFAGFDADGTPFSSSLKSRLELCTESIGFESCTERTMSSDKYGIDYLESITRVKKPSRIAEKRREKMNVKPKVFPPPLTMLNENGRPVFMLKPERKDGRLELSLVQVHRRESLRAYRENGRLRMYLVKHDGDERAVNVGTTEDKQQGEEDRKQKKKVVAEEEWQVHENCSGVVSNGHHHDHQHNMHGWGQQSVTIK